MGFQYKGKSMDNPVDILFITFNRIEYVNKTINHLLGDTANFRLYLWDNGSKDGTADVIREVKDERIAERHLCPVNVMQAYPTEWFLDKCRSEIIGKIDDDTIAPYGWIDKIGNALETNESLGMVGCWTFWPEDYERNRIEASKRIIDFGNHQILHNSYIGGTAFLMKHNIAKKYYIRNHMGNAFPIDRIKMTLDGYISGWYFPLIYAEHMDDPRSEHCLMTKKGGFDKNAALTAKVRNIKTPEQYLEWIMKDADNILTTPVKQQLKNIQEETSFSNRIKRKIKSSISKIF
jgi:glycosyltransferase involved in cell wall biosynthesis